MNHILYASDLENGSRVVLHAAIDQAIKSKGRIYFLHVSEQFHRGQDETLGGFRIKKAHDKHLESLKTEIRTYMKQRIHSFVAEELQQSEFNEDRIEVIVSFGEPAKKIVEIAEEIEAQMIVMGDRRVNALSRLFLGSTAQKVIHSASKPVLIVPISNTIKQTKVGA